MLPWHYLPETSRIELEQLFCCLIIIHKILTDQWWILTVVIAAAPDTMATRLHRAAWIPHQEHNPHIGKTVTKRIWWMWLVSCRITAGVILVHRAWSSLCHNNGWAHFKLAFNYPNTKLKNNWKTKRKTSLAVTKINYRFINWHFSEANSTYQPIL